MLIILVQRDKNVINLKTKKTLFAGRAILVQNVNQKIVLLLNPTQFRYFVGNPGFFGGLVI